MGAEGFGTVFHLGPNSGKDCWAKRDSSEMNGNNSSSDGSLIIFPAASRGTSRRSDEYVRGVHYATQFRNIPSALGHPMRGADFFSQYANRRWGSSRQTSGAPSWGQRKQVTDNPLSCGTNRQREFTTDRSCGGGSTADARRPHISAYTSMPKPWLSS